MRELTSEQEEGLRIAIQRYENKEKYTIISGLAGVGKSYLAQAIIEEIGVPENLVAYAAYTGKASLVFSERGCKNTSTLHKLMYNAIYDIETDKVSFFLKETLPYQIIVVDEISMIPMDIWNDLLSFSSIYILALGDPGQLSPIYQKDEEEKLLDNPHIHLTQIMRQAADNDIIAKSLELRETGSLKLYQGKNTQIIENNALVTGMFDWADQTLCATNQTKNKINHLIRDEQQRDKANVEVGDKIISLKNHWDTIGYLPEDWLELEELYNRPAYNKKRLIESLINDKGIPLTNGTIGYVEEIREVYSNVFFDNFYFVTFVTANGVIFKDIPIDKQFILNGVETLSWIQKKDIYKYKRKLIPKLPKLFDFGYAITVWKAQGSEWDNILLIEENFPYEKEEHKKFLYTGMTRAKEKLVVIQK